MNKFYLAHSRSDQEEVREIELRIEKDLSIDLINPFWDIDYPLRWDRRTNEDGTFRELTDDERRQIVEVEKRVIQETDGLVVLILKGNTLIGLSMEVHYAFENLHKSVFIYAQTQDIFNHPWLRMHSTFITDNLGKLIMKLQEVSD